MADPSSIGGSTAGDILGVIDSFKNYGQTVGNAASQTDALTKRAQILSTAVGLLAGATKQGYSAWVNYTQTMYDVSKMMNLTISEAARLENRIESLSKRTVYSQQQIADMMKMQATNFSLASIKAKEYDKVITEVNAAFGAQGVQAMKTFGQLAEKNLNYANLLAGKQTSITKSALLLNAADVVGTEGALNLARLMDQRKTGPTGTNRYLERLYSAQLFQRSMSNIQLEIGRQAAPGVNVAARTGALVTDATNAIGQSVGFGPLALGATALGAKLIPGIYNSRDRGFAYRLRQGQKPFANQLEEDAYNTRAQRKAGLLLSAEWGGITAGAGAAGAANAELYARHMQDPGANAGWEATRAVGGLVGQAAVGYGVSGKLPGAIAGGVAYGAGFAKVLSDYQNAVDKDAKSRDKFENAETTFLREMKLIPLVFEQAVAEFSAGVAYGKGRSAIAEGGGADVATVAAELALAMPAQQALLAAAQASFAQGAAKYGAHEGLSGDAAKRSYLQTTDGQKMWEAVQNYTKATGDMALATIPLVSTLTNLRVYMSEFILSLQTTTRQSSTITAPSTVKYATESMDKLSEATGNIVKYFNEIYSDPTNVQGIQRAMQQLQKFGEVVQQAGRALVQVIDVAKELPTSLKNLGLTLDTQADIAETLGLDPAVIQSFRGRKFQQAQAEYNQLAYQGAQALEFRNQSRKAILEAKATMLGISPLKPLSPEEIQAQAQIAGSNAASSGSSGIETSEAIAAARREGTATYNKKRANLYRERTAVLEKTKELYEELENTKKARKYAGQERVDFKSKKDFDIDIANLEAQRDVYARETRRKSEDIRKFEATGATPFIKQVPISVGDSGYNDAMQARRKELEDFNKLWVDINGELDEAKNSVSSANIGAEAVHGLLQNQSAALKKMAGAYAEMYKFRGLTGTSQLYEAGLETRKRLTEILPMPASQQFAVRAEEIQWTKQRIPEVVSMWEEAIAAFGEGSATAMGHANEYYSLVTKLAQSQMDLWGGFTGRLEAELDNFINGPADILDWQPRAADVAGMDIPWQAKPFMRYGSYGQALNTGKPVIRDMNLIEGLLDATYKPGDVPLYGMASGIMGVKTTGAPEAGRSYVPIGKKLLDPTYQAQLNQMAADEDQGVSRSEKGMTNAFMNVFKQLSSNPSNPIPVRIMPESSAPQVSSMPLPPGYTNT